jgi:hypothetical protein
VGPGHIDYERCTATELSPASNGDGHCPAQDPLSRPGCLYGCDRPTARFSFPCHQWTGSDIHVWIAQSPITHPHKRVGSKVFSRKPRSDMTRHLLRLGECLGVACMHPAGRLLFIWEPLNGDTVTVWSGQARALYSGHVLRPDCITWRRDLHFRQRILPDCSD